MPRPRATTPTQATIASAAGVSVPTVSKALRDHPSISEATRARVQAAARSLGYPLPARTSPAHSSPGRTDPTAARTGSTRTQRRVTALYDTVNNTYAADLLEGMLTAAGELGITLQVEHAGACATDLASFAGERLVTAIVERVLESTDGLILVTMTADENLAAACQAHRVPVISIDPAATPPAGMVSLASTNWRGAKEATEHLLALGHTRIAVAAGPASSVPTVDRVAGYRSALAQAGVPYDPGMVRYGDYSVASGAAALPALLDLRPRPTAVLALSDRVGVGVLAAARERGLNVPRDLSVVGFDDTQVAELSVPALTAVHQPLHEMGVEAMQLMSRAIDLGHVPGLPVELRTHLVVRESTAPPRRRV